jgi:hypothetical protein
MKRYPTFYQYRLINKEYLTEGSGFTTGIGKYPLGLKHIMPSSDRSGTIPPKEICLSKNFFSL